MSTNKLSARDIKRSWHLINAKNKVLGRLSSEVASLLIGKHKPFFVPYLDTGDFVVIVNAGQVLVTGKKETDKKYIRHSGYPGGYRERTLAEVRKNQPEKLIIRAVSGMVPKTKLGRQMMKKLHVFVGSEHPFQNKFKSEEKEGK